MSTYDHRKWDSLCAQCRETEWTFDRFVLIFLKVFAPRVATVAHPGAEKLLTGALAASVVLGCVRVRFSAICTSSTVHASSARDACAILHIRDRWTHLGRRVMIQMLVLALATACIVATQVSRRRRHSSLAGGK